MVPKRAKGYIGEMVPPGTKKINKTFVPPGPKWLLSIGHKKRGCIFRQPPV